VSRRSRSSSGGPRVPEERAEPPAVIQQSAFWQGPLPPPAALEQFRQIVPDAPERIFAQWEQEAAHRRQMEAISLKGNLKTVRVGQAGAIGFSLLCLSVSALGFWLGYPVEASAITCTTVALVVGAFLYQRRKGE